MTKIRTTLKATHPSPAAKNLLPLVAKHEITQENDGQSSMPSSRGTAHEEKQVSAD